MYGTRDAPAEWQAELERTMIKLVFRPVVSTPCLYCHSSLGVLVVGHVIDLMCVGPRIGLDTFLAKLMSILDLTSTFLGPGPVEEQEGKFLGRSTCWRSYGLTWTGDVKLVNEALQEWDMSTSDGLETPGMIDECDVSSHEIAEFMSKEEAAKYRRTAAKLNYLSLDNPMIAFGSKRGFKVNEFTQTRRGDQTKKKIEILA